MITRIQVDNFKSLRHVEVDLGPFNVLIGKNGSGKSSFLQAIQMLSWLVRHRSINDALESEGLSYNELVHLKARSSRMSWSLDLMFPGSNDRPDVGAHVEMRLAKRRYVYVQSEWVLPPGVQSWTLDAPPPFLCGRSRRTMYAKEGEQEISYRNVTLPHSVLLDVALRPDKFPVLSAIARQIGGFLHYEIWGPEFLRAPSTGVSAVLSERGQNLPSVLNALRSRDPDAFKCVESEIRSVYPWLQSIEITHPAHRTLGLSFLEAPGVGKRKRLLRYQPSQVSDGFLRLLALTMLKYQKGAVSAIGYEEPENGMHPAMLRRSVALLREIAKSGTQVIVTTHSPFLLQYLLSEDGGGDPENELKLVLRGKEGDTDIRPPDPQVLGKARAQGVGVGELWGMLLGEDKMAAKE